MKASLLLFFYFLSFASAAYSQWIITNGPQGIPIYSFAASDTNMYAAADTSSLAAAGGTVFLSTNNGLDWRCSSTGLDCPEIRALSVKDTVIYAGSLGGGIYVSENFGASWTNISSGLTDNDVYALLCSRDGMGGTNLFAGTLGGGVYLLTEYGSSWINVNSGLTNLEIYALDFIEEQGAINIFAGTGGSGVFVTTDNGSSWTQTALNNYYIHSLAVIGTNIFASAEGGGIFLSTDNGIIWTNISNGIPFAMDLAVSGENIFALTNWGPIYHSSNYGNSWKIINEGIIDTLLQAIGINENYIFASGSEGVWRRPLEQIMDLETRNSLSVPKFRLLQNYPNPFNPSTTIGYSIPYFLSINLKIYDVLGNEIEVLINEEKQAGNYEINWKPSEELPSGVYFCRLQAGSFVQTRKMILMR